MWISRFTKTNIFGVVNFSTDANRLFLHVVRAPLASLCTLCLNMALDETIVLKFCNKIISKIFKLEKYNDYFSSKGYIKTWNLRIFNLLLNRWLVPIQFQQVKQKHFTNEILPTTCWFTFLWERIIWKIYDWLMFLRFRYNKGLYDYVRYFQVWNPIFIFNEFRIIWGIYFNMYYNHIYSYFEWCLNGNYLKQKFEVTK